MIDLTVPQNRRKSFAITALAVEAIVLILLVISNNPAV
jgi:hypothetical protein